MTFPVQLFARWRRLLRGRRELVDVERRLNGDDVVVPLVYVERRMARHCQHLLIDCRVDASSWCDNTEHPAFHPGRRCLLCDGVVDLIRPSGVPS